MSKRYKIGVIGAGARGETFARQLYRGTSRAELFGICDVDPDRLKKFVDYCELPDARTFTDTSAFLRQPELDAVIVTVPEFAHAQVGVEAMRNGKHVYLEKPVAHTLESCYDIIEAQQETGVVAYVGFNMRASPAHMKLREIVQSGTLGQIIHISGLEQLHVAHIASFMRRFHRKSANSGGMLNHKCSHDLDIMLWVVGHQHKVVKISSFGGCNIFTPDKQPAQYCHQCPQEIYRACPYKDQAGFVFPVRGPQPIHKTTQQEVYGGDLCVFNAEKDLVDNQTVIMEWDNGIRGNFNLQGFQSKGKRATTVWGEKGMVELSTDWEAPVRVTMSDTGDTTSYRFEPRKGGHGGTDPQMISRFIDAIEAGSAGDSGLLPGLAATMVARKADEARLSGRVVQIDPREYAGRMREPALAASR